MRNGNGNPENDEGTDTRRDSIRANKACIVSEKGISIRKLRQIF
jgi:hypothetical protein